MDDEESLTFTGCDCEHEAELHCFLGCDVDDCPCEGAWSE